MIKYDANTLEELEEGFKNNTFKFNDKYTQLIGIHDGSDFNKMLNHAAIINSQMFYTFIIPGLDYL